MAKAKSKKVPVKKSETRGSVEPHDPFSALRGEFDQMIDRFSRDWPMVGALGHLGFPEPIRRMRDNWDFRAPAVDVTDKKGSIEIRAELPGMNEDDIKVEISGSLLTISGEKKEEREEGKKDSRYYLSECKYGSFERSIRLPEGVNRNKVDANVKNGVLVVTIAKTSKAPRKAKKVKVKVG